MSNLSLTQMSLWAVPHANPTAEPEPGEEMMMIDISGRKCDDLLELSGQESLLLKMLREAYHQDLQMKSAWTWKAKATPRLRLYFQLEPLAHHTGVLGCSLWPTPSATDDKVRQPPGNPHITRNGTLRHINRAGTQSAVRTSQAVRYFDDSPHDYENIEWKETLMGLPPGWTDLTRRKTSPVGPPLWAIHRKTLNRRASKRLKELTTAGVIKPSATRLYGSKYSRWHGQLVHGYMRKMEFRKRGT